MEGVWIETDGFDYFPYIADNQELQGKQHLFDLKAVYPYQDRSEPLYLLGDFHLRVLVPVMVVSRVNGQSQQECLNIELWTDEEGELHAQYSLLDAKTCSLDADDALHDLGLQLLLCEDIKVCGCCQYGVCNPYGGNPFYNHLCFKQVKNFTFEHEHYNKMYLVSLMHESCYTSHLIIDSCEQWRSRYCQF